MEISKEDAAYYRSDPRRGGKDVGRDRLRAGANLDAGRGICRFLSLPSLRSLLPWLLAAFTSMTVVRILSLQVDRVSGTGDVAMSAARAGRTDAAEGAPRRRLSARHGAVRQPRHRKQQDPVGVLIFVSLAERYARIIVDTGSPHACRRLAGRQRWTP